MTSIVLDSSAVLAMVYREPGGDKVHAAIVSTLYVVSISAVNWSEVLAKLGQKSSNMTAEQLTAILPGVEVEPFGQAEAEQTATLAKRCPALSLGDRACLALAILLDATAWTTDKIWAQMPAGAKIEMLR
ncbi:MAG: type II toxin-antitoxin system VapC family toxin [Terracidiphilus sp.]|jgi:PIN domain nuclease of toxin-antitoxin system